MPDAPRGVKTLVLAFLLYLAAWPLWDLLQPYYTAVVVRAAAVVTPRLEFPVLTETLEFDGFELQVRSRAAAEPVGTWKDLRFPFYLPFILILILVFPGVPRRDRLVLAGGGIALLFVLHVVLVLSVVQQIHHEFLNGKGATLHSPALMGWFSFRRRVLFHFGNQLFSATAFFLLFLRYGDAPAPEPLGRHQARKAGAIVAALLLAVVLFRLVHPILKRNSGDYPGLQLALGTLYERRGRLPEAAAAFDEALRADPDNPRIHNNLGVVLGRMGEWESARLRLERAVAIDPGLGEANRALGVVLLRLDRPCEAVEPLRRAQPFFAATADPITGEFLDSVDARCRDHRSAGTPAP